MTWFAVSTLNGVSLLHSTRGLQTLSSLFAQLIVPYHHGRPNTEVVFAPVNCAKGRAQSNKGLDGVAVQALVFAFLGDKITQRSQ